MDSANFMEFDLYTSELEKANLAKPSEKVGTFI